MATTPDVQRQLRAHGLTVLRSQGGWFRLRDHAGAELVLFVAGSSWYMFDCSHEVSGAGRSLREAFSQPFFRYVTTAQRLKSLCVSLRGAPGSVVADCVGLCATLRACANV